jgi:hypothetical protein
MLLVDGVPARTGGWRLRTAFGEDIVVVRDRDARKEGEARRIPSLFIRSELPHWLLRPRGFDRGTLMDMYCHLRGESPTCGFSGYSARDLVRYVLPALEDAFERGRLVAFAVPRPSVPSGLGPPRDEGPGTDPRSEAVDWVEVIVTDDASDPYLGPFRLDLPDGRVLSGRFNMGGSMRADAIPGGSCTLAFPELHVRLAEGA